MQDFHPSCFSYFARLCAVALVVLAHLGIGDTAVRAQERAASLVDRSDKLVSGYLFRRIETRRMQDDDSQNPGFLWIDLGVGLWSRPAGKVGKSCASCHEQAEQSMKGVGATYPKIQATDGRFVNLEMRINQCRTEKMGASAWEWESNELLAMTAYVRNQSRGMPVKVKIDGPARPHFENGKAVFNQRFGQLDMSCSQCHDRYEGKYLRGNWLSQGHTNGFPTYILPAGKFRSLHEMFRHCNERVRAMPYEFGAKEYLDLELYMAWRGNGLPVETPSVR